MGGNHEPGKKRDESKNMATRQTETVKGNDNGGGAKWRELPEPTIVDGFWEMVEGNVIVGAVLERDEGEFGGFYKIKTQKPTKAKNRGEVKTYPAGSIIGVNENAKLRQLQKDMKKGPIIVEITNLGKRPNDRGWDLGVKVREAY